MNKILKVGGIVLGILVFLFVSAIFLNASKSMLSSNTHLESGVASLGVSDQGASFSNPLPMSAGMTGKSFGSPSSSWSTASRESSYGADQSQDLAQTTVQTDKKIIKNGNLSLKVDSADKAAEKISEIAKANSGEIFSSNFSQNGSNVKSGTVVVKAPVANFEKTFTEIKKVASLVIRESTSGQDVTEEFIDLQAQLKNRQAEEQSFVKILDQAQKIQDVLDVTAQLGRVRGNIEQLQTRIKYLQSQTDMSTISISLTEDSNITVVDSWRPLQIVKESFNSLIKSLQGFINFLIRLAVFIIPLIAIWALLIWIIYKIGKKVYLRIRNEKQS